VVNFQKGSFLKPKLTFFAKIKQETGVHVAPSVMAGPTLTSDLVWSLWMSEMIPSKAPILQVLCARKREFGLQKRPSEVLLPVRLKLQNWVNFIIKL
jgi:hypothetical protein